MPITSDITNTERFDRRWSQRIGLVVGLALLIVFACTDPTTGLTEICAAKLQLPADHAQVHELAAGAQTTLAIALLMVVWWVTEAVPLPVTALAPGLLLPLMHVTGVAGSSPYPFDARAAFALYAHPVIYLFLGGFLIAGGMRKSGLAQRITLTVLSWRVVTRSAGSMIFGVMLVTALLSMMISNTATAAMMIPIALGMLAALDEIPGKSRLGTAMMLGIAWSASIGGIGTLIGSPPNLIAAANLEEAGFPRIEFVAWMKLGLPVAGVALVAAWVLLMLIYRPRRAISADARQTILDQRGALGRTSASETVVVGVVALVMLLWLTHHHWPAILPDAVFARVERFGVYEIGLLGGLLLFVIPTSAKSWQPVLNWADTKYVDWGTLVLFGGGLALSNAMLKTGLTDWIAGGAVSRMHGLAPLACLAGFALLVDYLTEITSNTAVTAMIAPIAIATAPGLGLPPETLCIVAAMAASLAFMLPVATPPNALVYATGYFRISQMLRAGFLMNLIGCGLMVAIVWALTGGAIDSAPATGSTIDSPKASVPDSLGVGVGFGQGAAPEQRKTTLGKQSKRMFKEIDPPSAKALLDGGNGTIYLDVRSQAEFAESHVPGALNIPILEPDANGMMTPNADFPRVVAACVPKDVQIIVGCKSGGRSAHAAEFMAQSGWKDVSNLLGGLHSQTNMLGEVVQPGWIASGLPVTQTAQQGNSYSELVTRTPDAGQQ